MYVCSKVELLLAIIGMLFLDIGRRFFTEQSRDFFKDRNSNTSILYVEDDLPSQKLLSRFLLLKYGLEIQIVNTAYQGIELLKIIDFELVFIDIKLPDMNGITALKEFRSLNKNEYTKYIAISAQAHPNQIELALAAGFDKYITKPIEFGLISDIIERTRTYI